MTKATASVRRNILAVFEDIGGRKAMVRWARANPDAFYKLYNVHSAHDAGAIGSQENPAATSITHRIVVPNWTPPDE